MSRKIIIPAAILVVLALVVGGVLIWKDQQFRPGSLPNPDDLPKAHCSDPGKTVKVSFCGWMDEIAGSVPFVYIYDPDTGTGRLAVSQLPTVLWPSSTIFPGEAIPTVSVLTVYTPQWQGLEGLLSALSGSFPAKIENCYYISYTEGQYLLNSTGYQSYDHSRLDPAEIIDPLADPAPQPQHSGLEIYMGMVTRDISGDKTGWTDLGNGTYVYLTGNLTATQSEAFSENLSVFTKIAQRFSLEEIMGLK